MIPITKHTHLLQLQATRYAFSQSSNLIDVLLMISLGFILGSLAQAPLRTFNNIHSFIHSQHLVFHLKSMALSQWQKNLTKFLFSFKCLIFLLIQGKNQKEPLFNKRMALLFITKVHPRMPHYLNRQYPSKLLILIYAHPHG